ncbi:MAG: T9SS type A sorting domain-containing protein [Actinomycetes bacterium]
MKKTLLLISAICVSALVSAQITITTADIAVPTTVVYQATDTLPTISVGSAGTSQTWNMTALGTHVTDTLTFLPYSAAPNPLFSTANLLVKQGWQNNYAYAINNAASLRILGNAGTLNLFGSPVNLTQRNNPAERLANFPFTYTTSFTNTYRTFAKFYLGQTIMGFQVDSIRDHSTVNKTVVVDAWGTLTTPLGTYPVIRSKETKITHDTVDAYIVVFPPFGTWNDAISTSADSVTSYTWWANGLGFSLATATMDSLGGVKRVQWLMQAPTTVGVNEYTAALIENVYPNPAQNEINLLTDASKTKSIQVFDIAGRLINTYAVSNNLMTINTADYANGLYTFSIVAKDNSIVNRGKFTINK